MVNVVVMTDDDETGASVGCHEQHGRGTGASVGCHEMVGAGVKFNVAGLGQQIASALRANSQSSDVLFNWITISLAIPQVVSLEKGMIIDSSMLTSLQNSHWFSTTGSVAAVGGGDTSDGAIVDVGTPDGAPDGATDGIDIDGGNDPKS